MNFESRTGGFSYLELLLSLALIAIMSVLISGTLDFGRRLWERSGEFSDYERMQLVRLDAKRWIESVVERKSVGEPQSLFVGTQTGLKISSAVQNAAYTGVSKIAASLTAMTENGGLVLRWTITHGNTETEELNSNSAMLAADLSKIKFSYFGSQVPDQPRTWVSEWPDHSELPRLVRIEAIRSTHVLG